jgi:hypothetical protein
MAVQVRPNHNGNGSTAGLQLETSGLYAARNHRFNDVGSPSNGFGVVRGQRGVRNALSLSIPSQLLSGLALSLMIELFCA